MEEPTLEQRCMKVINALERAEIQHKLIDARTAAMFGVLHQLLRECVKELHARRNQITELERSKP